MIIPPKIRQIFDEQEWNLFVQCVKEGFCVLYEHSQLIKEMSITLFHRLERSDVIKQSLIGTLMEDYTKERALQILEMRLNDTL